MSGKYEVTREIQDEYTRCVLCGYLGYRELFYGTDINFPQKKWRIVKCTNCGLARTDPYPTTSLHFQQNIYDSLYNPKKISGQRKNKKLSSKVRDYFQQKLESYHQKIYPERLKLLKKYTVYRDIFEIGFGNGKFLAFLHDRGWKVGGIELSKNAFLEAEKRYKLDLDWGIIEEKEYPKESFSLIAMYMVLEHIHKPVDLLKSLHQLLRERGILIIQVPNFASFQSKIFRDKWYPLRLPHHVYHYTPKTLERLLRKASFEVATISFKARIENTSGFKFSFKRIGRYLMGLDKNANTRKNETKTIPIRTGIIDFFVDPVFKFLSSLEELLQCGGTITVVARKIL